MNEETIRKIVREEASKIVAKNYDTGTVPPHVHNGVDGVQINTKNIVNFSTLSNKIGSFLYNNNFKTSTSEIATTGNTVVYPIPIVSGGHLNDFNGGDAPTGTLSGFVGGSLNSTQLWLCIDNEWYGVTLDTNGGGGSGGTIPSGIISPYGGSSAPSGWLLCNGTSYLRNSYPNLFNVIGTTYGSADSTHFNVPDLRAKVPAGFKTGDTNFGTLGGAVGEATHTLTTTEIPSHTHTTKQTLNISVGGFINWYPQLGSSSISTVTDATGGDGAHNNIQPSLTVNYIIKT